MKKLLALSILFFSLVSSLQAESASTMSITDINDKTYQITGTEEGLKIKGLEGKIVFLEFFGHRNPDSIKSIPFRIKLQEKYKDKLAIVAIEVQGYTNDELTAFTKGSGINYIIASKDNASNLVDYISTRAGWHGSIPFSMVLDKKGVVQFAQTGMIQEASLEKLIKQLN